MKTAYELAMERLGGGKKYSGEAKERLAEIDRRYQAKVAEARIAADEKIAKALNDPAGQETIRNMLAEDLQRLARRKEAEKDKIRDAEGR